MDDFDSWDWNDPIRADEGTNMNVFEEGMHNFLSYARDFAEIKSMFNGGNQEQMYSTLEQPQAVNRTQAAPVVVWYKTPMGMAAIGVGALLAYKLVK